MKFGEYVVASLVDGCGTIQGVYVGQHRSALRERRERMVILQCEKCGLLAEKTEGSLADGSFFELGNDLTGSLIYCNQCAQRLQESMYGRIITDALREEDEPVSPIDLTLDPFWEAWANKQQS